MKRLLLLGLLGCAHTAPTTKPTTAGTAGTTLGPSASSLAFYVGDWSCDVTTADGTADKDYPVVGVKVAPAYGNWISIVVSGHGEQGTSELMGVDTKGVFHHVWTDSDGNYGTLTSPGWVGDSLVLEEDRPVAGAKNRMTLKKVDATHYIHLSEMDTGSGFKLDATKTCHKV